MLARIAQSETRGQKLGQEAITGETKPFQTPL